MVGILRAQYSLTSLTLRVSNSLLYSCDSITLVLISHVIWLVNSSIYRTQFLFFLGTCLLQNALSLIPLGLIVYLDLTCVS